MEDMTFLCAERVLRSKLCERVNHRLCFASSSALDGHDVTFWYFSSCSQAERLLELVKLETRTPFPYLERFLILRLPIIERDIGPSYSQLQRSRKLYVYSLILSNEV